MSAEKATTKKATQKTPAKLDTTKKTTKQAKDQASNASDAKLSKTIHPDYHEVVIVFANGKRLKTMGCYGKPGEEIHLEIDPTNHQAWRKGGPSTINESEVKKFRTVVRTSIGSFVDVSNPSIKKKKKEDPAKQSGAKKKK